MIARRVRRHRPQSPPAPHASAICLDVLAPLATTSLTTWLVTPMHRQTNIGASALLVDAHDVGEPADELGRVGAEAGVGHPLRSSVRMLDPSAGGILVLGFLQDHHLVSIVERPVDPDLADPVAFEALDPVVQL